MLVATPVFGWITSRYPRKVFLPWVYAFFILNILVFWAIFTQRIDEGQSHVWLGRVFFVWLSVFNLYVVSVFWSFMADIYTREQGRRLFGLLSSGHNLFPAAAILLLLAIMCIRQLRRWVVHEGQDTPGHTVEMSASLGGSALAGASHASKSNYFRAVMIASIQILVQRHKNGVCTIFLKS